MKKVPLPNFTVLVFQSDKLSTSNNNLPKAYFIENTQYNLYLLINEINGRKIEKPNPLLYLLYPPAVLIDIITFPIQIFIFNFGKTALG
jgi:hypothetical protein